MEINFLFHNKTIYLTRDQSNVEASKKEARNKDGD